MSIFGFKINFTLLLLSLTLLACSAPENPPSVLEEPQESDISRILDSLILEAENRDLYTFKPKLNTLSIIFIDNPLMKTTGQCVKKDRFHKKNIISLNKSNWALLTDSEKEKLLAHEIGHCILNKKDSHGIMAKHGVNKVITDENYKILRTKLFDDFFSNTQESL